MESSITEVRPPPFRFTTIEVTPLPNVNSGGHPNFTPPRTFLPSLRCFVIFSKFLISFQIFVTN